MLVNLLLIVLHVFSAVLKYPLREIPREIIKNQACRLVSLGNRSVKTLEQNAPVAPELLAGYFGQKKKKKMRLEIRGC